MLNATIHFDEPANDKNILASGECGAQGDNVTWVLTEDGTLTISGSGKMKDYNDVPEEPWNPYVTQITSVIIKSGIENIGNFAFNGCRFQSVTIPKSVTSIGNFAFASCKIQSVTIPEGVTSIGDSAFTWCTKLQSVTIPSSVTSIGASAFDNCESLTSVKIPNSVISIGMSAFARCTGMQGVTISENVSSIAEWAFSYCFSLQSVTIPESVTSIDNHAFYRCSALESVTIPKNVTGIADSAFAECGKLKDVYYGGSESQWKKIVIDTHNEYLTNATIHFTEPANDENILASGECGAQGDNVTWVLTEDGTLTISGSGKMKEYGRTEAPWWQDARQIHAVVVEPGVTSIGSNAFANNIGYGSSIGFYTYHNLKELTLPEGLTSIGTAAFEGCENLTGTLNLPQSVNYIGNLAFYCCSFDGSLILPSNVKNIGRMAFYCSGFTGKLALPANLESIGDMAFYKCGFTGTVTLGSNVTQVSKTAFGGTHISGISVAAGNSSFASEGGVLYTADRKSLLLAPCGISGKVVIPEGTGTITDYAFYNCAGLSAVTIPASVTDVENSAFYGCGLKDVYYNGEEAQWKQVDIADGNDSLANANIHYTIHTHDLRKVAEKAATCTEPGVKAHWLCQSCGECFSNATGTKKMDLTETVIAALGHKKVIDPKKDATCTESGLTEGKHCSVCNKVLVAQKEIPALGHKEVVDPGKDPTCTEPGLTEGKHCSVCNEVLIAQKEIPALGHKEVVDPGKDPTCTEPGQTEGKHCSVCNKVLVEQKDTPAVGHSYSGNKCVRCGEVKGEAHNHNWVKQITGSKAATCTEKGMYVFKCKICGEQKTEWMPALGHSYSGNKCVRCGDVKNEVHEHNWKKQITSSKAATCTEQGMDTFKCKTCGAQKTEAVAALGHSYSGNKCVRCGKVKDEAHEHSWEKQITGSKAATCTEQGMDTFKCGICGAQKTEAVEALGHHVVNGVCTRCGIKQGVTYTITYSGVPQGVDNPNPTEGTEGTEVTLQDLTRDGYTFKGWYNRSLGGQKLTVIPAENKKDVTLYAQWTRNWTWWFW